MKKVLVAVLAIAMVACLAQAQEVTSVNVVGFNKIEIGAGKLALVTLPFESFGDSTLEDLVGAQLPQGSGAFIWDRVNNIYVAASRTKAGWSGTNIIHRGDGFWLRNAGATTASVSFMGEVPAEYNNSATTTVHNISGTDAVGYAYPTDVVWTNTTLAQAAQSGSGLFVWDEGLQTYATYSKTKAGWSTPVGFSIPAGRGFWISTATPIDWTEIAPYDL